MAHLIRWFGNDLARYHAGAGVRLAGRLDSIIFGGEFGADPFAGQPIRRVHVRWGNSLALREFLGNQVDGE